MHTRTRRAACAGAALALLAAVPLASAQDRNLETLKQFRVATTDLNIPTVPQTGRNADAIREMHNVTTSTASPTRVIRPAHHRGPAVGKRSTRLRETQ